LHDMLWHSGKIESRLARHKQTHAGKFDQLALPASHGLSDAIARLRQKVHTDPEV
jgi:ribose 1,5-bisphosphokinase PhnN